MRIVHIYNNNVVIAQSDSGEQAVVFRTRSGVWR